MPDPIFLQLGVASILVIALISGLKWMAKQNDSMQARIDAAALACEKREAALVVRIQDLENRQSGEQTKLLAGAVSALGDAAEALRLNAKAFERYAEESGRHNARQS